MQTNIIDDIGAVIGTVSTMRLLAIFGGTKLYVPEQMTTDHPIALTIGLTPAQQLSTGFAREQLELPDAEDFHRLRRVRCVAGLLRASTAQRDVAIIVGISTKQVGRYRAEAELLGLIPMVFDGEEAK